MSVPKPTPTRSEVAEGRLCSKCASISFDYDHDENRARPRINLGTIGSILQTVSCALCAIIQEIWKDNVAHQPGRRHLDTDVEVDMEIWKELSDAPTYNHELDLSFLFHHRSNGTSGDNDNDNDSGSDRSSGRSNTPVRNSDYRSLDIHYDMLKKPRYLPVLRITHEDVKMVRIPPTELSDIHFACRSMDDQCNLKLMKDHLQTCMDTHGEICEQTRAWPWGSSGGQVPVQIRLPAGFRLIDVESWQIIEAPSNAQFVALSYRWDGTDKDPSKEERHTTLTGETWRLLTTEGGVKLACLPKTVMDAVEVCRALDLKFLWVDSLCINQDDEEDLEDQIQHMDAIYSRATITIVEATDSEPSKGLECLHSRSPKQSAVRIDGIRFIVAEPALDWILSRSKWFTRGWTYQEFLMSKRLLVFTSSKAHYVCQTGTFAEDTTTYPLDSKRIKDSRDALLSWKLPWLRYPDSDFRSQALYRKTYSCWHFYCQTLVDYSRRELTKDTDHLAAISGILRTMGRHCDDTFFCGLPSKLFPWCLLWHPMGESLRKDIWPSWSWLGWTGPKCIPSEKAIPLHDKFTNVYRVDSALDRMSLVTDDMEQAIDQRPVDAERVTWFDGRFHDSPAGELQDHPLAKQAFIESGFLCFTADTTLLTITPDTDVPRVPVEVSRLRRYRILSGKVWIGTIFLGPNGKDPAGNDTYEGELERCEFVKLTKLWFPMRTIRESLFMWLTDYVDEDSSQPRIFSEDFYNHDMLTQDYDSSIWGVSLQTPMHHVMWVERSGSMTFRKAVGVIAWHGVPYEEWKEETIHLY